MAGRRLDRLNARAGQFFIWQFLAGPGWMRGHPFSLSDVPDGSRLRVTIQACGDGSWLPVDRSGDDPDVMRELLPDIADSDVYVCGPPVWIRAVKRAAQHAGAG
jgi:NAD(P)H-flavin reductase